APLARILAALRPARPCRRRVFDERARVLRNAARLVRRKPPENERHVFAGGDRELGGRRQATTVELQRCAELEAVGTGDRAPPFVDAPYPGDDRAVVETHDELNCHVDLSVEALDEPHEQRTAMP